MLMCRDVAALVTDYLDKNLSWPRRLQMRMHLLLCANCRNHVQKTQVLAASLRRLPDVDDTPTSP